MRLTACAPGWRQAPSGDHTKWAETYKAELFASLVDYKAASREAVGQGIRRWKRMGKPWLPAPGEFAELCRPKEHASHKPFKGLPEKPADPETAKKHIAEIRANRVPLDGAIQNA